MICFLHHLEEHGSHLNEYQINTLESLQHTCYCHVQFMHHTRQNTKKTKQHITKTAEVRWSSRDFFFFFHMHFSWTNNRETASGLISLTKMSKYKTGWHLLMRYPRVWSCAAQKAKISCSVGPGRTGGSHLFAPCRSQYKIAWGTDLQWHVYWPNNFHETETNRLEKVGNSLKHQLEPTSRHKQQRFLFFFAVV